MAEYPQFDADNFIETEGPNKGNVKDIELARKGAETENLYRSEGWVKKVRRAAPHTGQEQYEHTVAEDARKTALKKGISPQGAQIIYSETKGELRGLQRKMTNERITEEYEKLNNTYGPDDIIEPSGPNEGAIKDVEVAQAAAEAEAPEWEKAQARRERYQKKGTIGKFFTRFFAGEPQDGSGWDGEYASDQAAKDEIARKAEIVTKEAHVSPVAAKVYTENLQDSIKPHTEEREVEEEE